MDIELYKTNVSFKIRPYWKDVPPLTKITLGTVLIWDGKIEDTKSFEFTEHLSKGDHLLSIELYNKSEMDREQALQILDLSLGRIQSQQFVWQGVYRPRYPEPWASEQREQGIDLPPELHRTDYLGWNGVWCLVFSCPVFTWIHRTENLGWIYT